MQDEQSDPIERALAHWQETRDKLDAALVQRDEAAAEYARAKQAVALAEARVETTMTEDGEALDALLNTIPTTRTGLLRYVEAMASDDGFRHGAFRTGADFDRMCAHIITALRAQA